MQHLRSAVPVATWILSCLLCAEPARALRSTQRTTGGVPAQHASPGVEQTGSRDDVALPESWLSQVSAGIDRGEYHFSALGEDLWSAPNRSQELRSRVDRRGIEVFPRQTPASGEGATWRLRLGTTSFGRVGDLRRIESRALSVERERAVLDHGALVEWFVNDERGIEQGWTIANRPAGTEPLVIGLAVEGGLSLHIDAGGRSGIFVDDAGEPRARYQGLLAWDASGRELEARMLPGPAGVRVQVEDSGAVYPITVDPVMTAEAWSVESDQANAKFGLSVSTAGDVNGDGYSDVIVGAWLYDNGEIDEGRAFVYHGSAAGLEVTESWSAESNQGGVLAGAYFGYSVSTAGDVNGDGYSDVIVGAYAYDSGGVNTNEGRVFVYHGSATGLAATEAWSADSDRNSSGFGSSVSTAGDVNMDGYSDVIVGAWKYSNGETDEGRAYVYHGSSTGLDASEAWTAESNQFGASFGFSVSTAGDVNGDGYSDVIVGAHLYDNIDNDQGRAYVYHGSATGLDTTEAWTADPKGQYANFGISVASAGDVNGDGYADVLVGSDEYSHGESREGRANAFHGSATGLPTITAAAVTWRNGGTNPNSYLAGPPILGKIWNARVKLNTTGHTHAQVLGFTTGGIASTLPGGQTLLVTGTQVMKLPLQIGPTVNWWVGLPPDPSFCGAAIYTQAVHIFGTQPYALSNAQDLVIGY